MCVSFIFGWNGLNVFFFICLFETTINNKYVVSCSVVSVKYACKCNVAVIGPHLWHSQQ